MPYIGRGTSDDAIRSRFIYVASGSETSISGADANGAVLKFTDGAYVDVYLNGVLLKPTTDYNTNTANTIAGLAALSASDEVLIVVYDTFNIANTVDSFDGGTFQGKVTFENKIDMNGTELILDADADSSITADTDDQIDIRIAGADDFQFTANTFTALSGSSIATNTISETTSASGVTIDSVVLKDGTVDVNGVSDGIILDADGDTTICADTDDQIDFKTGGTDRMVIDSSGNVAIGGTPNSRLRLKKDGTAAYSNMTLDNTNSTAAITFGVGGSGTGNYLANNAFLLNSGNSNLIFGTNDAEKVRITGGGTLCVGMAGARTTYDEDVTPRLQLEGDATKATFPAIGITRHSDDTGGPGIYLNKTRGTSFDSKTVPSSGDTFGFLTFQGTDGTDSLTAATIRATANGSVSSNTIYGMIQFMTTNGSTQNVVGNFNSAGQFDIGAEGSERLRVYNGEAGCGYINSNRATFKYTVNPSSYPVHGNTTWVDEYSNGIVGPGGTNQWLWNMVNPYANPYGIVIKFMDGGNSYNSSSAYHFLYCWDDETGTTSGVRLKITGNGDVTNSNNSYGAISDERYKTDIADAKSQWDDIKAIKFRNYKWKDDPKAVKHLGVIAQEIEATGKNTGLIDTSYVNKDGTPEKNEDGKEKQEMKTVKYSILYMKAVKALQEAMERIEALETSNADLIKRIEALEAK